MRPALLKIFILCLILTACGRETEPSPQQTPAASLTLEPASFADLAGWQEDDLAAALPAFLRSCRQIARGRNQYIDNSEIKIDRAAYLALCRQAEELKPQDFRAFLEQRFAPWLVTYKGGAEGKFTAYYEPMLHVSPAADDKYKYPIHAKPLDLIEFNPHDFDSALPSKRLVGRVEGQKLVPYYTRADIAAGKGDIPVLLWADNKVDVYIMHIQGPAVAKLEDGSQIRISYADTNGLPFKGIGSILLEHKELAPGQASMGHIKQWLLAHPQKAARYMDENPRYVFHRLIGAPGPLGAMGIPLEAGRSLAVDRTYIPLGALLWLDTVTPDQKPLRRLVNAQDVGGAIKGAVRGDFFWGSGGDDVLAQAGKMNSVGRYYILLPRDGEKSDEQKNI